MLALAACTEPPPSRELPLEPLADQTPVYGKLRLTPSPRGHAGFTVSMMGLEPGATYVLCLNAQEAGSPSSDALGNLGVPGYPLGGFYPGLNGGFEGYWDFEKIQADARGGYLKHFELPLPPQAYRVKFLVKSNYDSGARPVLTSQPLLLDVRAPVGLEMLTGIAALAALPLAFIVRGRGRRRTAECPDDLEALNGEPYEPLPSPPRPQLEVVSSESEADPVPLGSACATTWVERARAEGVLLHHKNYAWIEIHGKRKSFRPRQAFVFRILCEHDPNCDGMPQDEIIKAWEEEFRAKRANPVRVRDIFRSCEHEPGDFIVRVAGPASVYRLRLEATPPPHSCDPENDSNGFDSLHDEG
jgi:hypothetical protein